MDEYLFQVAPIYMENTETIVISDSDDQDKDNEEMDIEEILPKTNLS